MFLAVDVHIMLIIYDVYACLAITTVTPTPATTETPTSTSAPTQDGTTRICQTTCRLTTQ